MSKKKKKWSRVLATPSAKFLQPKSESRSGVIDIKDFASWPKDLTTALGPPPPGFDTQLWALLRDIELAGAPLTGKIAEYAGFYRSRDVNGNIVTLLDSTTNNKNEADQQQLDPTGTTAPSSQPNKSLDKLTFLIIFRLPFCKSNLSQYYGDPLTTDPNNQNTWSYRANQLRTGSLLKLNERGEQVNGSQKRCDDNLNLLDSSSGGELNTPESFSYYNDIGGVNDLVKDPVTKSTLVDQRLTGIIGDVIKSYELYLYLTLVTEGKFKQDADTLSVVQFPTNIFGFKSSADKTPQPIPRRREVNFLNSPYPEDGAVIKKEPPNKYYVIPRNTTTKVYVERKYPDEVLDKNGVHSIGATVFEMEGLKIKKEPVANIDTYYATYYATLGTYDPPPFGFAGPGYPNLKPDVQFEKLAIEGRAGVTMGWGFDIGQGIRENYQYDIVFRIWRYAYYNQQVTTGTTQFTLRYKKRSTLIDFHAGILDMENALLSLLELKARPWPDVGTNIAPKTIEVTQISSFTDPNYPAGWDIKIIRANMDLKETKGHHDLFVDEDGFFNIYSSTIFYQKDASKEPVYPNIKILPEDEKDRYVVRDPLNAPLTATQLAAAQLTPTQLVAAQQTVTKVKAKVSAAPLTPTQLTAAQLTPTQLAAAQLTPTQLAAAQLTPTQLAAAQLTPTQLDAWIAAARAWTDFTTTLTNFFNDGTDWLDSSHFKGATGTDTASAPEITDFAALLRGCYNIRCGNAFLPICNHYSLMKKFRLPLYALLYPNFITFHVRHYFTEAFNALPDDTTDITTNIKNRTNAAEKYVLSTIKYMYYANAPLALEHAIMTKNFEELRDVVIQKNPKSTYATRQTAILDNLERHFKQHLYRNIEEA